MNSIYMKVDITTYENGDTACTFHEIVDHGDCEITDISLSKAQKLMWELVKAGGERKLDVNRYNRHITMVTTTYWARH